MRTLVFPPCLFFVLHTGKRVEACLQTVSALPEGVLDKTALHEVFDAVGCLTCEVQHRLHHLHQQGAQIDDEMRKVLEATAKRIDAICVITREDAMLFLLSVVGMVSVLRKYTPNDIVESPLPAEAMAQLWDSERRIMTLFLARPQQAIPFDELLHAQQGSDDVPSSDRAKSNVMLSISRLKPKVAAYGNIESVRATGYRWESLA